MNVETIAYCCGAAVSLTIAVTSLLGQRRAFQTLESLEKAPGWNLSEAGPDARFPARDGDFVVVTGVVATASTPLVALDGEECAVLSEVTTTRQKVYAAGGMFPHDTRSTTRTFRDTEWGLSSGRGGLSVAVPRDSVRAAHERDPYSVQSGLSLAGVAQEMPTRSWISAILRAFLTGVGDLRITRTHYGLPVGITVSVAGALSFSSLDGRAVVRLHPSLGLFLFRGSVSDLAATFRRVGWEQGLLAAIGGGAAIAFLWKAARARWAGLPSLRQRAATLAREYLGIEWPAEMVRALQDRAALVSDDWVPDAIVALRAIRDVAAAEGEEACVVCWDKRRVVALVPCGHVCMCSGCVQEILHSQGVGARCPSCRASITSTLRVWVGSHAHSPAGLAATA